MHNAREILIPNAVKVIKYWEFFRCSQLTTAVLDKGLEDIELEAFGECTLLHEILITHTVKEIQDNAFARCTQLTTVILGKELVEIRACPFHEC